jgi:replicative DNA helicase
MARRQLGERAITSAASVDGSKLRRPWLMGYRDLNDIAKAAHDMDQKRLVIDDSPSQTVAQIAATARRVKSRQGLSLIMIDYLSLVDGVRQPGESRQEEVARISRRLKALARTLRVPLLCLHQLSRNNEATGKDVRRPRMSDLRESGQVEQDADSIILIHRPDYYDPNDKPGVAEVIVAKNRNGPTGQVELVFLRQFTRFDSLSRTPDAGGPAY